MKKTVLFLTLTLILSSCVNINVNGGKPVKCKGEVVEQAMDFSGFTGITVEGAATIDYVQAESFKVLVTANEEVFNYLDYSIRHNELVLSTKDNVTIDAKVYKLLIEAPVINQVIVEGAADLNIPGGYKSEENLEIEIDGAARLNLSGVELPVLDIAINGAGKFALNDINVDKLEIEVNGAGSGSVSGVANYAKFIVAGTGRIDASALQCPNIEKHVEGLGIIK